jgi:hypothetical protein
LRNTNTLSLALYVHIYIYIYIHIYSGDLLTDENYKANKFHHAHPIAVGEQGTIEFDIKEDMPGTVYVYYELDNFYQNHRRYVKSRMDAQLRNALGEASGLSDEDGKGITKALEKFGKDDTIENWAKVFGRCEPMQLPAGVPTTCKYGTNVTGKPCKVLWPCGLIASSFFNDVFNSTVKSWTEKGISWDSDRQKKFINPKEWKNADFKKGSDSVYQYLHQRYPKFNELTGGSLEEEGVENEHFIVWMRTAGLPTFRKLYARIPDGVKKGPLRITVHSHFEVNAFKGNKKLVISTVSWLGGKNYFLGVAYLIVGIISILLAVAFFVKHKTNPRKLGDSEYLVWNDKDKQN